jgi:hypothetical protein
MADVKTYPTNASVPAFLDRVPDARRREDARAMAALMQRLSGNQPRMWGSSIVGFGTYTYQYESGRAGDWPLIGFAPRAKELVLYFMSGFEEHTDLMRELGRYKTGKACLYVRTLDDIKLPVLTRLIEASVGRKATRRGASAPAPKSRPIAKVKANAKAKISAQRIPGTKPGLAATPKPKLRSKPTPKATPRARSKAKPAAKPAARKRTATSRR